MSVAKIKKSYLIVKPIFMYSKLYIFLQNVWTTFKEPHFYTFLQPI